MTDKRMRANLAGDVAELYVRGMSHAEIGAALNLSRAQAHKILNELFAEGMPKLKRPRMSDEQARDVYVAYLRGERSIRDGAEAIGFTRAAAVHRIRSLHLRVKREWAGRKPARPPAHAEQRVITALLMARVDELRVPLGLSLERLAGVSGVSMWTLQRSLRSELSDPRLTTVLRLCRGLGVTAGELLGDLPLPVEPRPRHARRPRRTGAET